MNMTRIMGLDYGSKTVGVAVSDGLGLTAQGVETITRTDEGKLRRTLARIEELSKGTCKKDRRICRYGGKTYWASGRILGRAPFYRFSRTGID